MQMVLPYFNSVNEVVFNPKISQLNCNRILYLVRHHHFRQLKSNKQ